MTATKIQPVAEICSASHDDAQFGERDIKLLRDISGFEYGTPLYAGAAPAAVAPQGEYPSLPDPDSYLFQHEETGLTQYVEAQQVEWGFEKNNPRWKKCEGVFSESQMHAYFELGRQAAPALEAPAAPAALDDEAFAKILADANCEPGTAAWQYLGQTERAEWLRVANVARQTLLGRG